MRPRLTVPCWPAPSVRGAAAAGSEESAHRGRGERPLLRPLFPRRDHDVVTGTRWPNDHRVASGRYGSLGVAGPARQGQRPETSGVDSGIEHDAAIWERSTLQIEQPRRWEFRDVEPDDHSTWRRGARSLGRDCGVEPAPKPSLVHSPLSPTSRLEGAALHRRATCPGAVPDLPGFAYLVDNAGRRPRMKGCGCRRRLRHLTELEIVVGAISA